MGPKDPLCFFTMFLFSSSCTLLGLFLVVFSLFCLDFHLSFLFSNFYFVFLGLPVLPPSGTAIWCSLYPLCHYARISLSSNFLQL